MLQCIRPQRSYARGHCSSPAPLVRGCLCALGLPLHIKRPCILHPASIEPVQPSVRIAVLPISVPDGAADRSSFVVPDGGNFFIVFQERNLRSIDAGANKRASASLQGYCKLKFFEVLPLRRSVDHELTPEPFAVNDHLVSLVNQGKKMGDGALSALLGMRERKTKEKRK